VGFYQCANNQRFNPVIVTAMSTIDDAIGKYNLSQHRKNMLQHGELLLMSYWVMLHLYGFSSINITLNSRLPNAAGEAR